MPEVIYPISPADLQEDCLNERFYSNLDRTLYWSDDWDPEFYVALARAGFISISYSNPEHGILLLPELQSHYALLDWKNLHISGQIKRLMRSKRFEEEQIELFIVPDHERVLERVLDYHGHESTWLTEPYRELLGRLSAGPYGDFVLHGVELWSRKRDLIIAGELGYTIGRTYTSLTGFCSRTDPKWRGFGTLQMVLLAKQLQRRGFAFWNMGHPKQAYKKALGAQLVERKTFLKRWLKARDLRPDQTRVQEANEASLPLLATQKRTPQLARTTLDSMTRNTNGF